VTWQERLREAVDRTGKKHSFVAEEAGIAPATLSRILTGRHQNPRFETVERIARACGVTIGWLMQERGCAFSPFELDRLQEAASIIREVAKEPEL
jgi:transcriptional regulator with XRE-family HTH domain